ncbi:MAG: 50S ribosomal protein L9 [Candidatus Omnitrophica bacterium]|nr:50S ribosomal protein L9 [Candidatus Omnitrophota bacterium]
MKVVLKVDLNKLGKVGDVVEVAQGYARNYLFPQDKALEANNQNLQLLEQVKKVNDKKLLKLKQEAEEIAKKIEGVSCTIVMQAHDEQLYGAVTSADIAKSLLQEGISVDKKDILLEEPIKALGVYHIPVKLHPEVKPQVKVWVVKE